MERLGFGRHHSHVRYSRNRSEWRPLFSKGDNTDPDAGKYYLRDSVSDPVNCWVYQGNLMGPEGPALAGNFQFVYTDDGTAKVQMSITMKQREM